MRVFTFLITLILALGFIILNFLGFNNTLSNTEYILASLGAEIVIVFLLGHFMYRTYANYKKAKHLTTAVDELTAKLDAANDVLSKPTATTAEAPAATTMNHTTLFQAPVVDTQAAEAKNPEQL